MSGLKAGMDEIYSKPLYFETMKEVLIKYDIIWTYDVKFGAK